MKKCILTFIISCLFFSIYGQSVTKITGFVPDLVDSIEQVEFHIVYPFVIGQEHKVIYRSTIKSGVFEFTTGLKEPVSFAMTLNDTPLLFPGTSSTIINPGDSVHIYIPNSKKLGMINLQFSGQGSEKINFQKAIVAAKLKLYKKDPDYALQSLEYKFKSTDQKLDAIDSVYHKYHNTIPLMERNLIRTREYYTVLDNLLITAMESDSDSLRGLFQKYLVKKNRIAPFFKANSIYYDGNFITVRDYILLSEYKNPKKYGGTMFRKLYPVKYCELIIKHLKEKPLVKEYLLCDAALNVFSREQNSENAQKVYKILSENVRHESPFYNQIMNVYQIIQSRLKKGMPFYNFSLSDTGGKIHNLSDFKGKVVVLDIWFNGCSGCGHMARTLDSLEDKFKGKNIQFISVSIDRNKKLWLNGIGRYSAKNSLQLFTEGLEMDHPLIKFLNPRGFPFLVAVDKNGNLIGTPPDPRFSEDAFTRYIEQNL